MDLLEAVRATYAVLGQDISDLGLAVMIDDLQVYPLRSVLSALTQCRKELKRMTLADILDRLPGGHPKEEEGWTIAYRAMTDQAGTVVWTEEIRDAFGVALALADDPVQARMAFKERYAANLRQSRNANRAPKWSVSLGTNHADRERALTEGLQQGRLTAAYVQKLLPIEHGMDLLKRIGYDDGSNAMPALPPAD